MNDPIVKIDPAKDYFCTSCASFIETGNISGKQSGDNLNCGNCGAGGQQILGYKNLAPAQKKMVTHKWKELNNNKTVSEYTKQTD